MKKNYVKLVLLFLLTIIIAVAVFLTIDTKKSDRISKKEKTSQSSRATDNPHAWAEYEFELLQDPATKRIPEGIREAELAQAATMPLKEALNGPQVANSYALAGPDNIGGRTRAFAYDIRYNGTTNRIMLAGGVSGSVFKSTDDGATWTRVSQTSAEPFSVTTIVQDPRVGSQDTWYYATGESLGNSASGTSAFYLGHGIYKSTNNGDTWTRLASSNTGALETFDTRRDLISKLVVDPTNGNVYAACVDGIMRSTDGGTSWGFVLDGAGGINSLMMTDLEVTSTGRLYAAFSGEDTVGVDFEGVWTSTTGAAATWTQIAGASIPAGWPAPGTYGRVVLALAPSNQNILYALLDNGSVSDCSGTPAPEVNFYKWDESTDTWTDRSANMPDEPGCLDGNDPIACQGGYDLVVAVKPDNENFVLIGGTNAYRSTDGFASTAATTRIGGYVSAASYGRYLNSHADIHNFTFRPGSSIVVVHGNDGGIQRTADITAGTVAWTDISNGYFSHQYYYVTLDPTSGSDKYLGGAQDQGTTYRNAGTNSFVRSYSGDGVSVGISSGNAMHFVGFQNGNMLRKNPALAENFFNANLSPAPGDISPLALFITLFYLDPENTENLYYVDGNELWRDTGATTASSFADFEEYVNVAGTIGAVRIRSLATSRGTYNAARSKLYFGTQDGRVYRIDDPVNADPATVMPVHINSGAGMPAGTVIGLAVNPRNSDTVVAVYSNYGVNNIWFCGNATSGSPTWTSIEGTLTLPSIRSVAIVKTIGGPPGPGAPQVANDIEYYVGTSTGLYSATDLTGGTTAWAKEGSTTIGNAVVGSLAYRPVDNTLLAGTHGNGMYATSIALVPVTLKNFKGYIKNNHAYLEWQTTSEQNNKGFEVQRSYDGRTFEKIGFINGKERSNIIRSYNFTDRAPLAAVQHYRLRQIDLDGKAKNSSVVVLKHNENSRAKLLYITNPFRNTLSLTFSKAVEGRIQLELIDEAGRVMWKKAIENTSSNTISLPVADMRVTNGTYFLRVRTNEEEILKKVVKH